MRENDTDDASAFTAGLLTGKPENSGSKWLLQPPPGTVPATADYTSTSTEAETGAVEDAVDTASPVTSEIYLSKLSPAILKLIQSLPEAALEQRCTNRLLNPQSHDDRAVQDFFEDLRLKPAIEVLACKLDSKTRQPQSEFSLSDDPGIILAQALVLKYPQHIGYILTSIAAYHEWMRIETKQVGKSLPADYPCWIQANLIMGVLFGIAQLADMDIVLPNVKTICKPLVERLMYGMVMSGIVQANVFQISGAIANIVPKILKTLKPHQELFFSELNSFIEFLASTNNIERNKQGFHVIYNFINHVVHGFTFEEKAFAIVQVLRHKRKT